MNTYRRSRRDAWALVRRSVIGVVGGTITAVGVILMPVPGPGLLFVLLGLSILAREFGWARQAQQWVLKARTLTRRWRMTRRRPLRQLN